MVKEIYPLECPLEACIHLLIRAKELFGNDCVKEIVLREDAFNVLKDSLGSKVTWEDGKIVIFYDWQTSRIKVAKEV